MIRTMSHKIRHGETSWEANTTVSARMMKNINYGRGRGRKDEEAEEAASPGD